MSYTAAISFGSLYRAANACAKNVRWKESVQDYLRNHLARTIRLRRDLAANRYGISEYVRFTVTEPKRREIVSTRFRDRVFQRAMCENGLYDEITRSFIYDNCACLNRRGVDFAIRRLKCHLQRFHRKHGTNGYVMKLDVTKFFPSIPHSVAKAVIAKRVADKDFVRRVNEIIDSFSDPRRPEEIAADPFSVRGIALGSQISQLIALAVLDDLDHTIKERLRIRHYIRYMDDLIAVHESKEKLRECWRVADEYFRENGLKMNAKSSIFPVKQGVVFLKYRFFFTASGKLIYRVSHKSVGKERRRFRAMYRLWKIGVLTTRDINEHFTSWCAHAGRANTLSLIRKMRDYGHKLFRQETKA